MTAGQLAQAMRLTGGAMTTVLDRLERAGYARRVRDTVDRRRVMVEVTPEVRRLGEEIYGGLAEGAQKLFAGYADEQLELILEFLVRARALGEEQLDELEARLAAVRQQDRVLRSDSS
jgi:DNA-binding MarR family transcriptional regulator